MADIPVRPQIALENVCRIVLRAREFDAKDTVTDEGDSSNPVDHNFVDILEANKDDPVFQELKTAIDDLHVDDQCDLVALVWTGRGDYGPEGWREARAL